MYRKIINLFFVFLLNISMVFAFDKSNDPFYAFYGQVPKIFNGKEVLVYQFKPLSEEVIEQLPKELKNRYKKVLNAENFYNKRCEYPFFSKKYIDCCKKAIKNNPCLYPAFDELQSYYLYIKDYKKAEFYNLKIPNYYDSKIDLILAEIYFLWGEYDKAIESSNDFLNQANSKSENIIEANCNIMASYYNKKDYNNALKYSYLLLNNYKCNNNQKLIVLDTQYCIYYNCKYYESAIQVLKEMLKISNNKNEINKKIQQCYTQIAAKKYGVTKTVTKPNGTKYIHYVPNSNIEKRQYSVPVQYGYNAQGEYVPIRYGNSDVRYGYNTQGRYVPVAIGNNRIEYNYNAQGQYVPSAIGNTRINYGYNTQGDYVPTSVGNDRIEYGYNAMGDYAPMSIGGQRIKYGYNAYGEYVPIEY